MLLADDVKEWLLQGCSCSMDSEWVLTCSKVTTSHTHIYVAYLLGRKQPFEIDSPACLTLLPNLWLTHSHAFNLFKVPPSCLNWCLPCEALKWGLLISPHHSCPRVGSRVMVASSSSLLFPDPDSFSLMTKALSWGSCHWTHSCCCSHLLISWPFTGDCDTWWLPLFQTHQSLGTWVFIKTAHPIPHFCTLTSVSLTFRVFGHPHFYPATSWTSPPLPELSWLIPKKLHLWK